MAIAVSTQIPSKCCGFHAFRSLFRVFACSISRNASEKWTIFAGGDAFRLTNLNKLKNPAGMVDMGSLYYAAEVQRLMVLLDEKSAALLDTEEQLRKRKEMQLSMEQRLSGLENRISLKEREVRGLEGQVSALETSLEEKDLALLALAAQQKLIEERNDTLRQAVTEAENRKAEWKKQEEMLVRQLKELEGKVDHEAVALQEAKKEARTTKERYSSMSSCIENFKRSLKDKVEELNKYRDACGELQSDLTSSENDNGTLKSEMKQQMEQVQRSLLAAQRQLKQTRAQLEAQQQESALTRESLASKEADIIAAEETNRQYREKNSSLEFSLQTLQAKVAEQRDQIQRNEEQTRKLLEQLGTAESELASNDRLTKELQEKLEAGRMVCSKLGTAEEKIRKLEALTSELSASAMEKDEKILAWEQAYEQLANSTNDAISTGKKEMENRVAELSKLEKRFAAELEELQCLLDEKATALDVSKKEAQVSQEQCRSMQERIKTLEASSKEKTAELLEYKDACGNLHSALKTSQADMMALKEQTERRVADVKDARSATQQKLNQAMSQLESQENEISILNKATACKEEELDLANQELRQFRERNSALEFSIETLKGKLSEQLTEVRRREDKVHEVCSMLGDAEEKLAANDKLIKELQVKLEVGAVVSAKLAEADEKVRRLEVSVADSMALAQDKDEKATALQQALQQMEDARNSAVTRSMQEMEKRKAEAKLSEERLSHQLEDLGSALEEKLAALDTAQKDAKAFKQECCSLSERNALLQSVANDKTRELNELEGVCMELRSALKTCVEDAASLKKEMQQKVDELTERLSMAESRLKHSLVQVESLENERERLVKAAACKDEEVVLAREKTREYREKNSALEFSVDTLQRRVADQHLEVQSSEERVKEMCTLLANAETRLSANDSLIRELQVKLEVGAVVTRKLAQAEQTVKELEGVIAETAASSRQKDEKLTSLMHAADELAKAKADAVHAIKELKDRNAEWNAQEERYVQELQQLRSALRTSEDEVESQREQVRQLGDRNSSTLEYVASTVEEQLSSLQHEMCSALARAESKLASSEAIVEELRQRQAVAIDKRTQGEEKILELERLVVGSEWTIQRLADDIRKVKTDLTSKERELSTFELKFEDMERQLKSREEELTELESIASRLQEDMTFNAVEANRALEESKKYTDTLVSRLKEAEGRCKKAEEMLEKLKHDKATAETRSSLAMETLLADWKSKVQQALDEKKEFSVEHRRVVQTIEELREQLKKKAEVYQAHVAMLEKKLASRDSMLRKVLCELQKAQLDNKGVMQRMLSLQESLIPV